MRVWLLYPRWLRALYIGSLKVNGVALLVFVGALLAVGIAWLFGRLLHIGS